MIVFIRIGRSCAARHSIDPLREKPLWADGFPTGQEIRRPMGSGSSYERMKNFGMIWAILRGLAKAD